MSQTSESVDEHDFIYLDCWETCAQLLDSSSETGCVVAGDGTVVSVFAMPLDREPRRKSQREDGYKLNIR